LKAGDEYLPEPGIEEPQEFIAVDDEHEAFARQWRVLFQLRFKTLGRRLDQPAVEVADSNASGAGRGSKPAQ
jgi:hypothetical protein